MSSATSVRYAFGRPRRHAYARARGAYQSQTAIRAEAGRLGSARMETLRDVMSTLLVTVDTDATVAEAAQLMSLQHVGAVLIVDGDQVRGIFTERDIVRALAAEHDAAGHAVAGWMTADPITLGPDAPVAEARDRMLEEGFRHIPVVEAERLIGIVSLRDVSGR